MRSLRIGLLDQRHDVTVTRDTFSAALVRLGMPAKAVSFDGSGSGDNYAIEHRAAGWVVYYSERGNRFDEQTFPSERVALRYLLGWIIEHNAEWWK